MRKEHEYLAGKVQKTEPPGNAAVESKRSDRPLPKEESELAGQLHTRICNLARLTRLYFPVSPDFDSRRTPGRPPLAKAAFSVGRQN